MSRELSKKPPVQEGIGCVKTHTRVCEAPHGLILIKAPSTGKDEHVIDGYLCFFHNQ